MDPISTRKTQLYVVKKPRFSWFLIKEWLNPNKKENE